MFNSYSSNNSVEINAITGTIVKNYKDSFFKKFDLDSVFADRVFDTNSPHISNYGNNRPVVVLQMMMCGENKVIAELMWEQDFDKLYEGVE